MATLGLIEQHGEIDALSSVASHLDLASLGVLASVDHFFSASILADRAVWERLCETTFEGKVCIAAEAKRLRAQGKPREALRVGLADSRRDTLTDEELTTFEWNFRFKSAAGSGWMEEDPYWLGAASGPARVQFSPSGRLTASGFEMLEQRQLLWSWALSRGPIGSHVQLHVDGMRVPTYVVSRHAANWGWLMQSCWVLYTSFPMPPRGADPSLDDEALEVTVRTQFREAHAYNSGVTGEEAEEEELSEDDESGEEGEEGESGASALVQLANGEVVSLPMWLLQHLELVPPVDGDVDGLVDGDAGGAGEPVADHPADVPSEPADLPTSLT